MQPRTASRKPLGILMADDDPADIYLTRKALELNHLCNPFRSVGDGEELLAYLRGEGRYGDRIAAPMPGLVLLDLNMPRKDGRQALLEIKQDAALRRIPIVVLTTSDAEQDLVNTYDLGANSYITKPMTFEELVRIVKHIKDYWFEVVSLPC